MDFPRITKVTYLDCAHTKMNITRAGCIPYIKRENEIYFIFGIDSETGDYTDFGGGFSLKNDLLPVIGAVRELREESLGLFWPNLKQIQRCYCIHNDRLMVILIRLDINLEDFQRLQIDFGLRAYREIMDNKKLEVAQLHLIPLKDLPSETRLYKKVRELFLPVIPELEGICSREDQN